MEKSPNIDSKNRNYFLKDKNYFGWTRSEFVALVKPGNNKVLEIGCGTGNTGLLLKKEHKAAEVIGIELMPEMAKIAEGKLDKVICGDIETMGLLFPKEYFDYVIAGDVLEHLHNPWEIVNKIHFYLKDEGCVIASIPNIRHWRVVRDLILKGKFKYQEGGVLDDTHLRFFTKKSILELFKKNKFSQITILPGFKVTEEENKSILMNTLTLGMLEEFLALTYVIIAKK